MDLRNKGLLSRIIYERVRRNSKFGGKIYG